MTDFVIRGIPGSPYVRSPLMAIEEKGLTWRLESLAMGGQRAPEWRAFQPFGKIPAFEHDGMRFYETQAFLRYLDRIAPQPSLAPTDARQLLRMDQLLNIVDCYVAPKVSGGLSFGRVVASRFGLPIDEEAIAAAIPEAKITIDEIARLLGNQLYLAGDQVSLADLHLIAHLGFVPLYEEGQALLSPHANLSGWIERMMARPSFVATEWDTLLDRFPMPIAA
ncbi:MAG: glutathione S-transferase family protein [Sphingomonadales bacterium]|nr:glutathione S-transferase family protein [Sphingomonadales bacterium]